jgi:HEAT repeat protein
MRHSGIAPQENGSRRNQHNQAEADAEDAARQVTQGDGYNSPDMRVLAIYALEKLKAMEALPQLRALLDDDEKIHFDGLGTVAEAARKAIATLTEISRIGPDRLR